MEACLAYQPVYCRRTEVVSSTRSQLLAGILLLSVLALKVWVKVAITDYGYQLAEERSRTVELDMQRRELNLQLTVLKRPDSLTQMAQERLGLQELEPGQATTIRY